MEPFQTLLLVLGIILSWLFYGFVIIFHDRMERSMQSNENSTNLDSNIKWAYYYFLLAFSFVIVENFGSQNSFSSNIIPNLAEVSFRYTIFLSFAVLFLKRTNYWIELFSLFLLSYISIPFLEFLLKPYGDNTKYYSLFAMTVAMFGGNLFFPLEKYSIADIKIPNTPVFNPDTNPNLNPTLNANPNLKINTNLNANLNLDTNSNPDLNLRSNRNPNIKTNFANVQEFFIFIMSLFFLVLLQIEFTNSSSLDIFTKLGIAIWVGFGTCLVSILVVFLWDRDEKSPYETLISFSMGFIAGMIQSVESPIIGLVVLVFIIGIFSSLSNTFLTKQKKHPLWIFFTVIGLSSCSSMLLSTMIQSASILNLHLWNLVTIRLYSFFLTAFVISLSIWILSGVKILLDKILK